MEDNKKEYINLEKEIDKIKKTLRHDFDSYRMGLFGTVGYKERLSETIDMLSKLSSRMEDNKKY